MPQKPAHTVPTRKLAAIMFTDIEGYTAIMQEDEKKAMQFRDRHRQVFRGTTEKYKGQILQYYGDGTLSIFDSAIDAVHCGIEMQRAFQNSTSSKNNPFIIPVRIGIHLGDIIYSEEEVIGDSVNMASRIESLAVAGSVFISEKVYDEIKNQHTIETQTMGQFALKNVEKPIEVFAIANAGLIIPDPTEIKGKATRLEEPNWLQALWNKGQVQLITGYFAGVWGLIEFIEWLLKRYQISPYWTDVLLVFFLSLTPSLLLYAWNSERIRQGKINFLEKLALPGNLALSALLIFIFFRGTDLGATTQTVSYNDEEGIEQFSTIVKPGFRKKLAIFNFNPEQQDDSLHQWMIRGIHTGIAEDITQNGYISIGFWDNISSLQEMVNEAKEDFYPQFLTGSYSVENDIYQITTKLYKSQNGTLEKSHVFKGKDFFALIDTMSMVLKKDLGFSQSQIDQYVDLPFAEAFTFDLEAYKKFCLFHTTSWLKYLEEAIALDSTFALASFTMAAHQFGWSFSLLEAKEAINLSMRHRQRLSESWKSQVKQLYFRINDQPEKAISLLKMQLELNPGNQNTLTTLTQYLYLIDQYEELLALRKKLATIDPNPGRQIDIAEAYLLNGQFPQAEKIFLDILGRYPNQLNVLASMTYFYALEGQFDKVDSLAEKIVLINPEIEPLAEKYRKTFQYARNHPQTQESLKKYTGLYRLQDRALEFDISTIKDILFVKGKNQARGFFCLPSAPDTYMLGNLDFLEDWHFVSDSSGRVYKIEVDRINQDQRTFKSVLWRQDSLIKKAMGLFSFGKEVEALEAFKQAYVKNPQHFYLPQYIKHLEFVLDPNNKKTLKNMKRYAGKYGPRNIWIEGDQFFYKRDNLVSKQQLLPIAPDLFYFNGGFLFQLQIVLENDKVKGTVSCQYNPETGEFQRNDNDYIPLDELKD